MVTPPIIPLTSPIHSFRCAAISRACFKSGRMLSGVNASLAIGMPEPLVLPELCIASEWIRIGDCKAFPPFPEPEASSDERKRCGVRGSCNDGFLAFCVACEPFLSGDEEES